MSRSYKKTPWAGDRKGKSSKRCANRTVRQWLKRNIDETLSDGDYKKLYESWDICDYSSFCTWEEYWNLCQKRYLYISSHYPNSKNNKEPDEKAEYKYWCKHYKWK